MRSLRRKNSGPDAPEAPVLCSAPVQEQPAEKRKNRGKKEKHRKKWKMTFSTGLGIGLLVMLVIGGIFGSLLYFNEIRPVPHGFETPEETVRAFFTALRKGEPEAVANTFALEEYADHFDFAAWLAERKEYSSDPAENLQAFPGKNAFARGLNEEHRRCRVSESIHALYRNLFRLREDAEGSRRGGAQPAGKENPPKEELPEQLLSGMKLCGIYTPEELCRKFPGLKKDWKPIEKRTLQPLFPRCGDAAELILEFRFDGRIYYQELTLIRLDEKWFICEPAGGLPGDALFTEERLTRAAG